MSKIVFISYAHLNRDEFLERFVRDLAKEVLMKFATTPPGEVAFYDAQRIETGDYWRDKLAAELLGCKACVAVCSPAFAASHFCGKELNVFLDRVNAWKVNAAAGQDARSPVFPVIWIATAVPPALKPFQDKAGVFPPVYAEKGLRTMFAVSKYRDRRREILMNLAAWIAEAVQKVDLPPRAGIPDFDHISSLFHDQDTPLRHGVAVLPLVQGKIQAQPFGDGRTLASLVASACGSRVPWRVIDDTGDVAAKLRSAREGEEVTLVVTDLETLGDPLWKVLVDDVDTGLSPPAGASPHAVVAVLRRGPVGSAADEQNADLTVRSAFTRAVAAGAAFDAQSIRSSGALEMQISQAVLGLRTQMINRLQPVAVVDPALVMAAGVAGISTDRQPSVVGPGGAV